MGFELPDGKTARNIQEQVAFLTEKVKELFAAVSDLGFKVLTVEELPEEGAARTIYLVPASDPEAENIYDEYIWTEDGWEKIGSTDIDLSNYATLDGENTFSEVNTFTTGIMTPSIISNYGDDLEVSSPETLILNGGNYGIKTSGSMFPQETNTDDLGATSKKYKDLYLSNAIYLTANWYIHESSAGIIYLENLGQNTGLKFERDKLFPETANYTSLGTTAKPFKNIYVGGTIDFGDNAKINKDSSNRINFLFNDVIKIKVGSNETYFANHVEPDTGNSYDLGRSGLRWRKGYIDALNDGTNEASTSDIIALITYAKAQGWIS